MGQVIGTLFRDIGTDLLLVGGALIFVGVVVLAIMNAFSIFDENMTRHVKAGVIKLMWSAAGLGGAGAIATFIGSRVGVAAVIAIGWF